MTTEKQLMFSLITGDVYTILLEELNNMDEYQVPLKQKPNHNCRKCYGRFYTSRSLTHNLYILCPKCSPVCIDLEKVKSMVVASNNMNSDS